MSRPPAGATGTTPPREIQAVIEASKDPTSRLYGAKVATRKTAPASAPRAAHEAAARGEGWGIELVCDCEACVGELCRLLGLRKAN